MLVNYSLDITFAALADATRREMLAHLANRECTISELAAPFDISLPAISRHVRVLEDAGLLVRERDGRVHRCNIDAKPIAAANEWLDEMRRFWESRLDSHARYLNQMEDSWPDLTPSPEPRVLKSAKPSPRRPKKSSAPGPTRKK